MIRFWLGRVIVNLYWVKPVMTHCVPTMAIIRYSLAVTMTTC